MYKQQAVRYCFLNSASQLFHARVRKLHHFLCRTKRLPRWVLRSFQTIISNSSFS